MASRKRRGTEEQIARLAALREGPFDDDAKGEVARALESKSGPVVAAAARVVGQRALAELHERLAGAFFRFLDDDGQKLDPGCRAKGAIVDVFVESEAPAGRVFLAGVRCAQEEPVYGGSVDTAVAVRAASAVGLARMGHPDATLELARLLADAEPRARAGAACALGATGGVDAFPLLVFKVLDGDDDPEVVLECMRSLLAMEPRRSLELVSALLDDDDGARAEAAAVALGESKLDAALPPLRAAFARAVRREVREKLLVAVALLRSDDALAFLVERIAHDDRAAAAAAVRACALFKSDERVRLQVERTVRARGDGELTATFARAFA